MNLDDLDKMVAHLDSTVIGYSPAEGDTLLTTVRLPKGLEAILLVDDGEKNWLTQRGFNTDAWSAVTLKDFFSMTCHGYAFAATERCFDFLWLTYQKHPVAEVMELPPSYPPTEDDDQQGPDEVVVWLIKAPDNWKALVDAEQPSSYGIFRIYMFIDVLKQMTTGRGKSIEKHLPPNANN